MREEEAENVKLTAFLSENCKTILSGDIRSDILSKMFLNVDILYIYTLSTSATDRIISTASRAFLWTCSACVRVYACLGQLGTKQPQGMRVRVSGVSCPGCIPYLLHVLEIADPQLSG